jgi:hypothetical protein
VFSIQLVIKDGAGGVGQHKVVETVASSRFFLYDAEHLAKVLLKKAKRRPSATTPDGYLVLDGDGQTVACSWVTTPRRVD